MRQLQYIFNVLMKEGILEFGSDSFLKDCYYIKGTDPFYITDEAWEAMQRKYEETT